MKNKKIFTFIILLLLCMPIITVGAVEKVSCGNVSDIPKKIPELTSWLFTIVQIAVPVILVIMGAIDLFKGITAQKEDEIKKSQQVFVKRLITGVLIFFVVVIAKFLVSLLAGDGTNYIVDCIDCFLNGCNDHKNEYKIRFKKNNGHIYRNGVLTDDFFVDVYGLTVNLDTAVSNLGYEFRKNDVHDYNFIGWSESSNCDSLISGEYRATSDKDFYACYEIDSNSKQEVTFVATDDSYFVCAGNDSVDNNLTFELTYNTVLNLSNYMLETLGCEIKKEGDRFLGWSRYYSCNKPFLEEFTLKNDEKLYSCWESTLNYREETETVVLYLGDATSSCSSFGAIYITKNKNSELDLLDLNSILEDGCEIIHPNDYKLVGWIDDRDYTTTCDNPITKITLTEYTELSACWVEND